MPKSRESEVAQLKELFKILTIYGDSEIFDVVFLPQIKKNPYVALQLAKAVAQKTVDGCIEKLISENYRKHPPVDREKLIKELKELPKKYPNANKMNDDEIIGHVADYFITYLNGEGK